MNEHYTVFMNEEKTVAVEIWHPSEAMYVKTRKTPDDVWGPPATVEEVKDD